MVCVSCLFQMFVSNVCSKCLFQMVCSSGLCESLFQVVCVRWVVSNGLFKWFV